MTPEEFRRHGRELVDWIADYLENVERYPVRSQVAPGDIRAKLPNHPPQEPESFGAVLADVNEIVLPGITHWQSPNFFAFFPASNSYPSILGEMLSAGLGVQGMLWAASPACTELETHVMDWLVEMLGLPDAFLSPSKGGGVIQDTASTATLCAILAARERATQGEANQAGGAGGAVVAYASSQAHSSVEKGLRIAGIGSDNLRFVDVDAQFAMRPDHLRELIAADRAAGHTPAFVCATVGTTSSGAIDPVEDIGRVCQKHDVWLHVDAAMAGTAALCPEFRFVNDGLDFADSYVFNPHKWMLTNLDCSAFFVRDRAALLRSLSILPDYLRNPASESGTVIDYRDWQIQLGRRFRALKLWFVIRSYGVSGLREVVRRHVALARELAAWVDAAPEFELAAPVRLSLVCFRHVAGDEANQQIMDRLNASGSLYLTHTRLDGKLTLRLSIGQRSTERRHVERAWKVIRETAGEVTAGQKAR